MRWPRLRPQALVGLLLAATVLVTYVFWRRISFGRRLDDAALAEQLAPGAPVRDAQHALSEVALRLKEGRPGLGRWVTAFVEVSRRDERALRRSAAWAMGEPDERPEEFLSRLREMVVDDPDETTRRNAACALSRAGDPAGRVVLRGMLSPFEVAAPAAGTVESALDRGRLAVQDGPVARLRTADGGTLDVAAPVPGEVREVTVAPGAPCEAGATLVVLGPDRDHAMSALAALSLVGTAEDLDLLRPLAAGRSGLPEEAAVQARHAIRAIERRTAPR